MNQLISFYQERLHLQSATFVRIDHQDTMVAVVYKITLPTGIQLILKICPRPHDFAREMYFLKRFAGILPVARVLDIVQPEAHLSGAILMECLPGEILNVADLSDSLAKDIGAVLGKLHLNRTQDYGDLTEPESLNSDPRIYFTQKFEESFAECQDHLPKLLLDRSRKYFEEHVDLLSSVDGPCTIHRDFRPGNLIVHNGKLQGIIDWASGRASFAEEDFCPMEHGEWPIKAKHAFLEGYKNIRPVPNYQSMMPLLRLSKALGTIGFTVKQRTWENTHTAVYQFNRHFLETFTRSLAF